VTIKLRALSFGGKGGAGPSLPSHYAWGTNGVCVCKMDGCKVYVDSYMASNGSCFMVTRINFKQPPLRGRPDPLSGDHDTPNAHNQSLILFYHVWGPGWIKIHWNSIRLRAGRIWLSHYTWGSMTTLHDFGGVLGRPLDTFFWAITISWSQLLVRVWSGPKICYQMNT
jgi:hypothetical protein